MTENKLSKNRFIKLFKENKEWLKSYIYRKVNDSDLAEDILQETYLKAYENRDNYQERGKIKGWLKTIAGNLCRDYFRRNKVRDLMSLSNIIQTKNKQKNHIELKQTIKKNKDEEIFKNEVLQNEFYEELKEALKKLSDKHREVLFLRYFADKSIRETSKKLSINEGTVKSRTYYALNKLKKTLSDYFIKGEYVLACKEIRMLLPEYVYGNLAERRNKEVKKHLKVCQSCRTEIEIFSTILKLLHEVEDSYHLFLMVHPLKNKNKTFKG